MSSSNLSLVADHFKTIEQGESNTTSDRIDESTLSSINKPHKANDVRWEAIQAVRMKHGGLGLNHFRLLNKLGCGDIGMVHLAKLIGTSCYFAMKVVHKTDLATEEMVRRAETERVILQLVDHPFLPTLYSHFETKQFSCLVMEFCPGGDLHTLRKRQPGKRFTEQAAKFYVAEVLLGIEYLHMLGIIYGALKPENVLVRDDGHVMLSDFDLSLISSVSPAIVRSTNLGSKALSNDSVSCSQPSRISRARPSIFRSRLLFSSKSKKTITGNHQPELVAEPTSTRSTVFLGIHEYLAPEIVNREEHGSAVDWWTLGIFLYELLFGKTPFKGTRNRDTLYNVINQPLIFPETPEYSFAAKDLIKRLLVKKPEERLAYERGATEIKQHPFFEGVNWALVRCASPPEIPKPLILNR